MGLFILVVGVQQSLSKYMAAQEWVSAPIVNTPRTCPLPSTTKLYTTLAQDSTNSPKNPPKICLTTLTDEKKKSFATKYFGWRNFDGLLAMTWENKQAYANKHSYLLFDESSQLDRRRPASWSKIRAVQRLLTEEHCDWVFWMDADTVVMNSDKALQDFLPANLDLVLSADDGGGYNAGAWLIRNTDWSRNFLETWWNMKSFVKPPGLAKSGDNDALKAKVRQMPKKEFDAHVAVPPRCTFNSFAKFIRPSQLITAQREIENQDYYMDEAYYHKGDLIAHVAGVDNKAETIRQLLKLAT